MKNYILNAHTAQQFPMVFTIKKDQITIASHEEIREGDQFVSPRTTGLTLKVKEVLETRKARGVWKGEVPNFYRCSFDQFIMENDELKKLEYSNY